MRGSTMVDGRWLRFVLAFGLIACGGGDEPAGGDTAGGEDFEETGSMRALREGEEAPPLPARPIGIDQVVSGDMSALRARPAGAPPADTRELYRAVAPATVIVRSQTTMGTGVIVGPNGLILTNDHVIRHAARDDGLRMRVTVEYGDIGEAGSMVPDGERRTAWVLKRDQDRDLALIRVEEPLEGRPVVGLSAREPNPGDIVTTLGHGNVGMVWAVRRCEVEATGRLEETYARLQAVCGSEDEQAAQVCETMRERMHENLRGLVIQSSCPLAPGDSGGPLVDGDGNLVGLNVMTIRNMQGQHSNFHIHVRELRDFLTQVPEQPLVDTPTPWIEPEQVTAMDQDLDGTFDTVMMRGNGTSVTLVDLDQDSPDETFAQLEQRIGEQAFDAEVALVTRYPHRFVWYDANADGTLELVLSVDDRMRVAAAHTVRGDEVAEANVQPGPALASSRVPASMRRRFESIFNAHLTENPNPMPALLRRGEVTDSNHDGVMDTIHGQRGLVHAVAFDVDQDSTRGLTTEGVDEFVRSGRLDAEFTMVYRDPTLWTFYDRDNDGTFDTGVRCAPNSSVIAEVLEIEGQTPPEAADVIGTLAIRGDWLGDAGAALPQMAMPHVVDSWIAYPEDEGGLPHPIRHHRRLNVRASYSEDGWENYVLRTEQDGYITSLVDVDRNSWRGRNRQYRDDLDAAVRDGHFTAEFAVISTRTAFWAWYDRDHDGTWDTVLVQVDDAPDHLHNAFVLTDGAWVHDEALVEGRPIRPELIQRRYRARFDALVRAYFADRYIAPAQ